MTGILPAELAAKSPYVYFVEWDRRPGLAIGIASFKIEERRTL